MESLNVSVLGFGDNVVDMYENTGITSFKTGKKVLTF